KDNWAVLHTCRVVPRRHDTAKTYMRRSLQAEVLQHDLTIIVYHAPKFRIQQFPWERYRRRHSVRREFYGSVETQFLGVLRTPHLFEGLDQGEIEIPDSIPLAKLPPNLCSAQNIGEKAGPVDDQERFAVDADVVRMSQVAQHVTDDGKIIRVRMLLRDEYLLVTAVPAARPVLVCPGNTKGKVGLVRS